MATAVTWTKMGVANRDGKLTSMDALIILQDAAGTGHIGSGRIINLLFWQEIHLCVVEYMGYMVDLCVICIRYKEL